MAQDNVRKAMAKGAFARSKRARELAAARSGTEGSRNNDRVAKAYRGHKRRNS